MVKALRLLPTLALIAACGPAPEEAPSAPTALSNAAPAGTSTRSPAPPSPPASLTPSARQTPFNANLPGPDERNPQALLDYWRGAVEAREPEAARRAWGGLVRGGGMAPRWTVLNDVTVRFAKGQEEGAAGSLFYRLPVEVSGTNADGAAETLSGTMTLRRANDVPGASAEQLSWRIESIDWNG